MATHRTTRLIPTDFTAANCQIVLEMLADTAHFFAQIAGEIPPAQIGAPLTPGEWSFHEVVAHLLTISDVSMNAIVYALAPKEPVLTEIHARREWGRILRYEGQPFANVTAMYQFKRRALIDVLQGLPEKQWTATLHRPASRSTTVYLQARGLALHDLEHVEHLKKVWKG